MMLNVIQNKMRMKKITNHLANVDNARQKHKLDCASELRKPLKRIDHITINKTWH